MKDRNLFSRLAAYSQSPHKQSLENFCTELIAHFFNEDVVFRRRFLRTIFTDQRLARPFKTATATTQETMRHDCRVDLVLRHKAKVHLVEVKISARETLSSRWGQIGAPQVQRYLDLKRGHVTYLTTRDALAPDIDERGRRHRLVKHALFDELHSALSDVRLAPLTKAFVDFMKENDMAAPEPLKRIELKRTGQALEIVEKCRSLMALVANELNSTFKVNFRTRGNLTRPSRTSWGIQCYLKGFQRKQVRTVGISISPGKGGVYFTVWMTGTRHPTIERIRRELEWDELTDQSGCCTEIKLRGDRGDLGRMIALGRTASRDLGRAIRKFD